MIQNGKWKKRPTLKECKWKGWMQQHLGEEQVIACNWGAFNLPAVSSLHGITTLGILSYHRIGRWTCRQCLHRIATLGILLLLKAPAVYLFGKVWFWRKKWSENKTCVVMCHVFVLRVHVCLIFSEWNLAVTFLSSSAFLFLLRYLDPSSGDQVHLDCLSKWIPKIPS